MKPAPFEYHAPNDLDEAVGLLAELDEAKLLAGGQSLVPMLNLRLAFFDHLVDLRHLDELRGVERRNGSLWIGAGTTQAAVERDPLVAEAAPLVAAATPHIGHFQIRNRGTVGGSLAHADPAAEYPAVAVALDATFEVRSPSDERTIAASDFFAGHWMTALGEDDVLTGIRFPVWEGATGHAVEEIARRHGDFAIAGAAVSVQLDGDTVSRCAIGLFGLGAKPERARAAEADVVGAAAADVDVAEVGRRAMEHLASIPEDLNGSADYRAQVGAVTVARALTRALDQAGEEAH